MTENNLTHDTDIEGEPYEDRDTLYFTGFEVLPHHHAGEEEPKRVEIIWHLEDEALQPVAWKKVDVITLKWAVQLRDALNEAIEILGRIPG